MPKSISRWLTERKEQRAAIAVAIRTHDAAGTHAAIRTMTGVIGQFEGRWAVRVFHGTTRPPMRAWYLVDLAGKSVEQVDWTFARDHWGEPELR